MLEVSNEKIENLLELYQHCTLSEVANYMDTGIEALSQWRNKMNNYDITVGKRADDTYSVRSALYFLIFYFLQIVSYFILPEKSFSNDISSPLFRDVHKLYDMSRL